MAAILIVIGKHGGPEPDGWSEAVERLRSRSHERIRCGVTPVGDVRWAAAATGAEYACDAQAVTIVDAVPFMAEPPDSEARTAAGARTAARIDLVAGVVELTRDAFGMKPLYYAPLGRGWAVASEVKCLVPLLPSVTVNREALSDIVTYGWNLGTSHLVDPIHQVLPSEVVRLAAGRAPAIVPGTSPAFLPDAAAAHDFPWYVDRGEELLRAALRRAAAAAGELHVLLSGGIDSTVLAALAQLEGLPVRGWIVRYAGAGHANPEYDRARAVAERLALPADEVVVPAEALPEMLPDLVWRMDLPPRHVNNVALAHLFRAIAGRGGGAVVHGDGAEAMFGLADIGRVRAFARKRNLARWVPQRRVTRAAAVRGLQRGAAPRERLRRLVALTTADFARKLDAVEYAPAAVAMLAGIAQGDPVDELAALIPAGETVTHEVLQTYQARTFLQCSLQRLDRLAAPLGLAVSLPFLSGEVAAFARRLPRHIKLGAWGGAAGSRPVVRALCDRHVPGVSAWPKLGFATPDRAWVAAAFARHRDALFGSGTPALAAVLARDRVAGLLALEDHAARWLALTLELALRQLTDRALARA